MHFSHTCVCAVEVKDWAAVMNARGEEGSVLNAANKCNETVKNNGNRFLCQLAVGYLLEIFAYLVLFLGEVSTKFLLVYK